MIILSSIGEHLIQFQLTMIDKEPFIFTYFFTNSPTNLI